MTTLIKDPSTGAFVANPQERTIAGLNGGATPTSAGDPYTILNQNLASILTQMAIRGKQGGDELAKGRDAITNVAAASAVPFDAKASTDSNNAMLSGTFDSFKPAEADVTSQLQNANAGLGNLGQAITGLEAAYQPREVAPGNSLITPGGNVVVQGPLAGTGPGGLGGASGGSGGSSPSIEAVFGKSNPIGAYAEDPQYTDKIGRLYNTITSLGVASNADSLQKYIENNAKGAPVTAQMIMNAAASYGVDPALLTTVLLHESDFGTLGAATKTMNPGNVGNTGTSTRNYGGWQQGVMAVAENLAHRIAKAPAGTAGGSSSAINVQKDATDLASGKLAPKLLQDRYNTLGPSGGVLYNAAIQMAKQLNPTFDETAANLKFQGQQTATENQNSGNPITSIFSNFRNALTTAPTGQSIFGSLSPAKNSGGQTSSGLKYTITP